ncbi:TasA family protein [Nocardioides sp. L-11A]|uniref:TasA family protein n=1 Tax=Nocardioides sp. L-11A TaxID=3043848 RepID=UPI00249B6318|nr:TasA family protein [Nocardioides sp. L-11A]
MRMSRKILVPLATLSAAGAIAVGSGATFTSQSGNTVSAVTAGTLQQTNSKDGGAIFDLANLKPGDTLNGTLTLTNTGSLPASFGLTETSSTNGFTGDNLSLAVTNTTTGATVYSGTFGGLVDGARTDIGVVQPGVANTFRFTVKLATATPNADQGKSASATYQWDSVQLNGDTYDH